MYIYIYVCAKSLENLRFCAICQAVTNHVSFHTSFGHWQTSCWSRQGKLTSPGIHGEIGDHLGSPHEKCHGPPHFRYILPDIPQNIVMIPLCRLFAKEPIAPPGAGKAILGSPGTRGPACKRSSFEVS